jgi:hypothetical protein
MVRPATRAGSACAESTFEGDRRGGASHEKRLRLDREFVIGDTKEIERVARPGGNLVIEGRFRYQACDATKCSVPEDVPLRWTLRYEPHDAIRVPPELGKSGQ